MKTVSMTEISANFGLSYEEVKRLSVLSNHPKAVKSAEKQNFGGYRPAKRFYKSEIDAFYQKLGIEPRETPNGELTSWEFAVLLGVEYTYFKRIQDLPPIKRTTRERFKVYHYYDKKSAEAYAEIFVYGQAPVKDFWREDSKKTPEPENKTNQLIREFLTQPSELRPRVKTTGKAKTTRVRIQGVWGSA